MLAGFSLQRNVWRAPEQLHEALRLLIQRSQTKLKLVLLAIGGEPPENFGIRSIHLPFVAEPARLAELYRAADVYVHPARADTFPTTLLEAAACGLPVVATRVGGIPEIVAHGKTGWLVPLGDPKEMADALEHTLVDMPASLPMCAAAAELARRRFDEKQMQTEYVNWLAELITTPPCPNRK